MAFSARERITATLDEAGTITVEDIGIYSGWLAHIDVISGDAADITIYDPQTDIVFALFAGVSGTRYSPRLPIYDNTGAAITGGSTPALLIGNRLAALVENGTALDTVVFDIITTP